MKVIRHLAQSQQEAGCPYQVRRDHVCSKVKAPVFFRIALKLKMVKTEPIQAKLLWCFASFFVFPCAMLDGLLFWTVGWPEFVDVMCWSIFSFQLWIVVSFWHTPFDLQSTHIVRSHLARWPWHIMTQKEHTVLFFHSHLIPYWVSGLKQQSFSSCKIFIRYECPMPFANPNVWPPVRDSSHPRVFLSTWSDVSVLNWSYRFVGSSIFCLLATWTPLKSFFQRKGGYLS